MKEPIYKAIDKVEYVYIRVIGGFCLFSIYEAILNLVRG